MRGNSRPIITTQGCLNAYTFVYLEGTVVRSHPMVWSLALCLDDAKQDSGVYGAELGGRAIDSSICLFRKLKNATCTRYQVVRNTVNVQPVELERKCTL